MSEKILEVKNLTVRTPEGKDILRTLDFSLSPGQVIGLLGSNGSGKTSLVRVLAGDPQLQTESDSSVLLAGQEILGLSPEDRFQRGLWSSFQQPPQFSGLTLVDILWSQFQNSEGFAGEEMLDLEESLQKEVRRLGLPTVFLERDFNLNFSGGEKKKMELIQLSVTPFKVGFLDEIDSGLDVDALQVMKEIIREKVSGEATLVLISHQPDFLRQIDLDEVWWLHDGEIRQKGRKDLLDKFIEKGFRQSLDELSEEEAVL